MVINNLRVQAILKAAVVLTVVAVLMVVVPTPHAHAMPDVTPAQGFISVPADGSVQTSAPVMLSGTATDNVGVGEVQVIVRNLATGAWLRADGTFGGFQRLDATVANPGAATTSWSFDFTPPGDGNYGFGVIAIDTADNEDPAPRPWHRFVVEAQAPDVTPAQGFISVPADGSVQTSAPVMLSGTATDNVGVGEVQVIVRNLATGAWLRADGTFGGFQRLDATVANPGAATTSWSFDFTPPGDGNYGFGVIAIDTADNEDPAPRPWHRFVVEAQAPDVTPAQGFISVPADGSVQTSAPVMLSGTATDNVGVGEVQVIVRNLATGAWLRADGTFGGFQRLDATVANPGAATTSWSFDFTPPGDGNYGFGVIAIDTADNEDPAPRPWHRFTLDVATVAGAPTYMRQVFDADGVSSLYPAGVVADGLGNLYVADSGGDRISKIDSTGVITPISTAGYNRPRAIALDSDPTKLWIADTTNGRIVQIGIDGTLLKSFDDGQLNAPFGISADTSGIYISDTYNLRVAKLSKNNGSLLWEANTCFGQSIGRTRGLGIGSDGRIYIADTDNHRVVSLDPATGACIDEFGGFGTGPGKMKRPQDVESDGAGGVYVADRGNNRIQHLANDGTFISQTDGSFGSAPGQLRSMDCVYLDGPVIGICDTFQNRISRFTESGNVLDYVDTIAGTAPVGGGFNQPFGVAYGPSGELYVSDMFNHRVQKLNPNLSFNSEWGGKGSEPGLMTFPRGIHVSDDGSVVTLSNSENNRIDLFDSSGTLLDSIKAEGDSLQWSYQSTQAPDGTYWVADTRKNRIVHLQADGTVLSAWNDGGQIRNPRGIVMDANGDLYISNTGQNRVDKYSQSGVLLATLATSGSGPTNVRSPHNLTFDDRGAEPLLWIADTDNARILVLELDGSHAFTFGSRGSGAGKFDRPRSVAINPVDGTVAVADFENNRISIWG